MATPLQSPNPSSHAATAHLPSTHVAAACDTSHGTQLALAQPTLGKRLFTQVSSQTFSS
ncbi:MAG: hypothetical protein IT377_32850 [Polyangiaceae bacterium]|nr:hypothetical protein [Polyangiaceae bacterium]